MRTTIADSATWLFVPGDRPERFGKAAMSGADVVIIDLEDAVAPARKAVARNATSGILGNGRPWAVRINAATTPEFDRDLDALATAGATPLALVLAKAERPEDIDRAGEALGVGVVALIESACGVVRLDDLTSARWIRRLAFGAVDFSLDIGAAMSSTPVDHARSELVISSRAAELPAPLDSPTLALDDTASVGRDAVRAKAMGMGGKLCIHPAQVAAVAEAFRPTHEEIRDARQILAAVDGKDGAISHNGAMIDRPVVERALRLLRDAGETD